MPPRSLEEIEGDARAEIHTQAGVQALDGLRVTNAVGAAVLAAIATGMKRGAFLDACGRSWDASEQAHGILADRLARGIESDLGKTPGG